MGQYIKMNLANEIYVTKKTGGWRTRMYDVDVIMEKLRAWFDLSLYDAEETKEGVCFTLKKEIFEKHFLAFLLEQKQVLYPKSLPETVFDILNKSDPSTYLEKIKEREVSGLYYGDTWGIYEMYCSEGLQMQISGITFFSEGKAILECSYALFGYLHKVIRKAFDNPLKNTVFLELG